MKIEPQVYTRYPIDEVRNGREQNAATRRNAASAGAHSATFGASITDLQKTKVEATSVVQSASADAPPKGLPKVLADILSSDEQAMLKQLFPTGGSKWGVNAYETQGAVTSNAVIGNRLDLTS